MSTTGTDGPSDAAQRRSRLLKLAGGGLLVVAVVAIIAVITISGNSEPPRGDGQSDETAEVQARFDGIEQDGYALGDADAPHTLTEFVDFQCPFCRDYTLEVLPSVIDEFVRDGRLRLELRPLAFIGPDSIAAAEVAHGAAGQDLVWQFADLFFLNQGPEGSGYADEAFLTRIAEATPGLDVEAALGSRGTAGAADAVAAAQKEATAAGLDSTPSFLLAEGDGDGRLFEATAEAAEFTAALEAELAE